MAKKSASKWQKILKNMALTLCFLSLEKLCQYVFKRIYVSKLDGDIFHYRDKSGLECDAVIHLRNGKYALAEVKLASQVGIDEGASHLLKIKDKIDTDKMGKPSFLMVITATRSAFRRSDGVIVCPLSCLTA